MRKVFLLLFSFISLFSFQVRPSVYQMWHWRGYVYADLGYYGGIECIDRFLNSGFNMCGAYLRYSPLDTAYIETLLVHGFKIIRQIVMTDPTVNPFVYPNSQQEICEKWENNELAPCVQEFLNRCRFMCGKFERYGLLGIYGIFFDIEYNAFPRKCFRMSGKPLAKWGGLSCRKKDIEEFNELWIDSVGKIIINDTVGIDTLKARIDAMFGHPLIDTFVPDGNDTVMLGYGALEGEICKIAQTFRPSDTIISGIGLRLMRNYPAYYSPITVMIEETDASGAPSGVRIARIDGRSAYFSIHWYRCSPDSFVDWDGYFPCRVDPNKTYAIVIRYVKSSIEGDTFSYYLKKAVDVYPDGNLWVYDADNDIWLPSNGDLVFWVYYPQELTVHDRWVQFKCNQVANVVSIYRQVLRDSIGMLPFMDFFTPVDGGDIVLGDSITAIAQSFYPSHEYFRGMEFFIRRVGNPGDILAVVKRMAVDPLNGNPVPEGEIIKVITIPFFLQDTGNGVWVGFC